MPLRHYKKEKLKSKSKLEIIKRQSVLPWSLLVGADIVIENPLILQLPSQLLDLLLLLVELFSVSIPFFSQLHPRPFQCPNVSGHIRMENGWKNPFFISNFKSDRSDDFIWHTQLLGVDTDPSEIWLHWKRSFRSQLMWVSFVNSVPSLDEPTT